MWLQKTFSLQPRRRGFHLITREVLEHLPEINRLHVGILHLFCQHTSASLTLNENADPSVRGDMERFFSRAVPQDEPYYEHNDEGSDDMPAHIKSSLLGASVTVPIHCGRLNVGTWQGIYLCEHRDRGGARNLVATLTGE